MQNVSSARPDAMVRRARLTVIIFFMLHGLFSASWVVRIPDIKAQLGLSDGELGFTLLGAPVGLFVGQFLVGWLIGKYGSKLIVSVMVTLWCVLFPLLGLAPNMWSLVVVLLLYGILSGGLDVSMNSQAATVEKLYGRPIMANFHGTWSIASVAAAAVGGFLSGNKVGVEWHFLVVAIFVLVVSLFAQRGLIPEKPVVGEEHPIFVLLPRSLFGLGLLAFSVLLIEGAMSDWSAVYLRENLGSPAAEAAASFVIFSLLMTVGRLTGDYLTLRIGPANIVRIGGLLVFVGMVVFLISPWPLLCIVAAAFVGAGIACPFPLVISAAARSTNFAPGRAISAVVSVGYVGSLLGPPLIGNLALLFTLRGALVVLCIASLSMFVFGGQVQTKAVAGAITERVPVEVV